MIADPRPTGEVGEPSAPASGDFSPGVLRALKIAVVVMGIILVVGFATLIGLIAYRSTKLASVKPSAPAVGERVLPVAAIKLSLPKGATFESLSLDGDRIAVHYRSSNGDGIAVVDLGSGTVVSRIEHVQAP